MARGSYGAWSVASADFREIRDLVVEVMEAEGFHVRRRRITDHDVKVEGIRGSQWLATLGGMLPLGGLLGVGSRVKAVVHCRRSLTESETQCRLAVRCAPVEEMDALEEEYPHSQDRLERIGDSVKARRVFECLVGALQRHGVLA